MSADVGEVYKRTAANLLRNPDNPEDLTNLFTLLTAKGERTPAHVAIARRAALLAPDEFIAVFNYAASLMRDVRPSLDEFKEALKLARTPFERGITWHHMGLAHHDLGQYQAALNCYERSRKENPSETNLEQSTAIAKLASGDLKNGLYEFEVKYHRRPRKPISDSGIPRWKGEGLKGKSVIVTHEQGFGDTLQFIRFAPRLRDRGVGRLVFSGHPALHDLIAENFEFDAIINEQGPFEADYVTSPMALTALLGVTYDQVMGESYMKAEPMSLPKRGMLKVGLSWKGNPDYAHDNNRSMPLRELCRLFDIPGAAFYSLQMRPEPIEIGQLGLDGFIGDLSPLIKSWKDTARAMSALDVIVTTDSANAHMAGALGKPTLLLVNKTPCWRWMANRPTTPWYKNTKLFRQDSAHDWSGPVAKVRDELIRMVANAR
jgi:tetratricopeptide (TPR) repeat protein